MVDINQIVDDIEKNEVDWHTNPETLVACPVCHEELTKSEEVDDSILVCPACDLTSEVNISELYREHPDIIGTGDNNAS